MTCTRAVTPGVPCGGDILDDGFCERCGLRPNDAPLTSVSRRAVVPPGWVDLAPVPSRDPLSHVTLDAAVPERRRFCATCEQPIGRSMEGVAATTEGRCPGCGTPFSFEPRLHPGERVAERYEVVGTIRHGGMGWLYMAKDRRVDLRWVVLKGLISDITDGSGSQLVDERRFLAEVNHPNIVKIIDFVSCDGHDYIVMEYVEGDDLGKLRREQSLTPGQVDAAWVVRVLAYGVALLDALAYLHDKGLLYCDLKPENVMCTRDSVKVVDLGAVQRVGAGGTTYGTEGFEAPEVRGSGPTPQSDLFSLARTIAMALADRPGALTPHGSGITEPSGSALFAAFPSLHVWLERGAAESADDRFTSADEMALQLLGVLQQVLAREGQLRVRLPSRLFGTDRCGRVDGIAARELPAPLRRTDEADAIDDQLRLVELYLQSDRWTDAVEVLERVRADHPDDWRVRWYEAVGQLSRGDIAPAAERFRGVRRLLPGELAPMLALGVVAEHGGDPSTALRWYDAVSRTDEWFISASFGAARCAQAVGRDDLAAREYERVPGTSSRYAEAQSSRALLLMGRAVKDGQVSALHEVAASIDALEVSPSARAELVLSCLLRGRDLLATGSLHTDELEPLLGWPFTDVGLRTGLESVYRELAALSPDRAERISLVDKANAVRPRTWA